jgi:hypothetical protein
MEHDRKKLRQLAKAKPNLYFFGDFVDTGIGLDFLDSFRKDILGFLKRASKNIKRKKFSDEEAMGVIAEDRIDLYTRLYTQHICESFVISCVIFLEQNVRCFAEGLMFALPLKLNMSDLRGSFIEKFKKYCQNLANIDLNLSDSEWEDIKAIVEIRNCLVHNGGNTKDFDKINMIKIFVNRYKTPCIHEGQLCLCDNTLLITLKIIRNFIDKIYDAALKKFPGPYS